MPLIPIFFVNSFSGTRHDYIQNEGSSKLLSPFLPVRSSGAGSCDVGAIGPVEGGKWLEGWRRRNWRRATPRRHDHAPPPSKQVLGPFGQDFIVRFAPELIYVLAQSSDLQNKNTQLCRCHAHALDAYVPPRIPLSYASSPRLWSPLKRRPYQQPEN